MSKNDDRETGPISVTLTTDYSLSHQSSLTSQLLNDYEVVNRGQVNPGSLELEKEPERLFTGNTLVIYCVRLIVVRPSERYTGLIKWAFPFICTCRAYLPYTILY